MTRTENDALKRRVAELEKWTTDVSLGETNKRLRCKLDEARVEAEELRARIMKLKVTIGAPKTYTGVVTQVLEEEVERLKARVKELTVERLMARVKELAATPDYLRGFRAGRRYDPDEEPDDALEFLRAEVVRLREAARP